MPPEEHKPSPKEQFSEIFASEAAQNKAIHIITTKKPLGSSRHSTYPYYKEVYAKAIQKEIDKMIESRLPIVFRYSTHCTEEVGMNPRTLYLKITQSKRCLIDEYDSTGKYAQWEQQIETRQRPGLGVVISFKPDFRDATKPIFNADLAEEDGISAEVNFLPKWRRDMEEWLEGEDEESFVRLQLALSETEVKELKIELAQLDGIVADVKSNFVKIVRLKQ